MYSLYIQVFPCETIKITYDPTDLPLTCDADKNHTRQQVHKMANTNPAAGGGKNYIDNSNGTTPRSKLPLGPI